MTDYPTLDIIAGPNRSHTEGDKWDHIAYRVRVSYQGRMIESPWLQGTAITHDPEVHDVVGLMLTDTSGIENCSGYHDWASGFGYNSDVGEHRDTYEAAKVQADALSDLLTRPLMIALMDDDDATYGAESRFRLAWDRAVAAVAAR